MKKVTCTAATTRTKWRRENDEENITRSNKYRDEATTTKTGKYRKSAYPTTEAHRFKYYIICRSKRRIKRTNSKKKKKKLKRKLAFVVRAGFGY